jgi:hypothetical protein
VSVEGSKLAKGDPKVAYLPPTKGPFYCGRCEYYQHKGAESSPCIKVKGEVERLGCCNLFEEEED